MSAFWDDLARDMEDPGFVVEFMAAYLRIQGQVHCPNPSWPHDQEKSLHEVETEEGHACLGCGAVV